MNLFSATIVVPSFKLFRLSESRVVGQLGFLKQRIVCYKLKAPLGIWLLILIYLRNGQVSLAEVTPHSLHLSFFSLFLPLPFFLYLFSISLPPLVNLLRAMCQFFWNPRD